MYDIVELNKKLLQDLREIAIQMNIDKADKLKKEELVYKILDQQAITPQLERTGRKTISTPTEDLPEDVHREKAGMSRVVVTGMARDQTREAVSPERAKDLRDRSNQHHPIMISGRLPLAMRATGRHSKIHQCRKVQNPIQKTRPSPTTSARHHRRLRKLHREA